MSEMKLSSKKMYLNALLPIPTQTIFPKDETSITFLPDSKLYLKRRRTVKTTHVHVIANTVCDGRDDGFQLSARILQARCVDGDLRQLLQREFVAADDV